MKNLMPLMTIAILISSHFNLLIAQPGNDELAWKISNYKEKRSQNIHRIVEISDGNLLAVGYSSNHSEGGRDILLLKIDRNGKLLKAQTLGGRYDDECLSAKYMPSGKILLCGYSKNKGLSQGIILLADEDLNTKLLYMDEKNENSLFKGIEIDRQGQVFVCGQAGSNLVVKKFSPKGEFINQFYLADEEGSSANALIFNRDGELYCTGSMANRKEFNRSLMFLLKLDSNLNKIGLWNFPGKGFYEGNDLKENNVGELVIAGGGRHKNRGGSTPAIAVVSTNGDLIRMETYPSFIDGIARGVAIAPCGDILIAGYGSDLRNAQRTALFSVRINPGNNYGTVWGPVFGGGSFSDEYNDVVCTSDGSVVFSGFTNNVLNQDYYIYTLKPVRRDLEELTILKNVEIMDSENEALNKNMETDLKITLRNNLSKDIKTFKVKIEIENNDKKGLILPESILVDRLRGGEEKEVNIPLVITDDFRDDYIDLKFIVEGGDRHQYNSRKAKIGVIGTYESSLVLVVDSSRADIADKDRIVLPVSLRNLGDAPALVRDMDFRFNENVSLADDYEAPVNTVIQVGEELRFNLICKVDSLFADDYIVANIKLRELSGYRMQIEAPRSLTLRKMIPVIDDNSQLYDQPIILSNEATEISFTNMAETVRLIDRKNYHVNFDCNLTPSEIASNFKFIINGVEIAKDSLKIGYKENNYSVAVPLTLGDNELILERDAGVRDTLGKINVASSNVNYYIYIIGTDLRDEDNMPVVRYSIKDVNDFYNKIKLLGKSKNTKVNIKLFNTFSLTTSNNLKGVFNELLARKHKFKANDVMIIYWVGQGFATAKGDIYVKGSELLKNRKNKFMPENYSFPLTSIYIPYFLGELPCKKIMLLDIFNKEDPESTGNNDEGQDYSLIDQTVSAIKTFRNFSYILSGNPGQKSYELQKVENGAFTYAVIQALEGNKGNLIGDNVMALSDFFENISRSIPDLVVKNGYKTWKQNPMYIKSRPEEDVVIFYK